MKCPIDQTEMEDGNLTIGRSVKWISRNAPFWTLMRPYKDLAALRCLKCGKVELTTELNKGE